MSSAVHSVRLLRIVLSAILLLSPVAASAVEGTFRDGDIIFQASRSSQSRAIQLATGSRYSHMGIIFILRGKPVVLEAVQPVKLTPFSEWVRRGEKGHYVVKRLKDADQVLTLAVLKKMKALGMSFLGRNYDLAFGWSDERIYCSELVWKVYQRVAGIEIGSLQRLGDFDLSHAEVKKKLRERYGDHVPLDEPVISPAAMFESSLLLPVVVKGRMK
ncbi:MAG: peptidoglycan peptidase [Nitrospirae bacterium GWC2_57_13]|jgi:hypothetical protein|nr:MAG: peptidoglycan peptidase [Nitrospirae bacterium GWC1_57_7]OGW26644.1 MAG: peptidoglycan peptidase [Nitrospirae bacterium GWC2_57_13]OGW46335.1 MAG: peptidoglycan peptidase [Nitrospirae bacterium GWD2_57_8]HAR46547.1 hypothetical protein [Nitrospiraceae bacterium]